ncbi:MAG: sugar ABC transporter substrate-binding protein, partial [Chloroflexi bacterium]|nr:sugar ABC transporter substrate-binding protein [Chloroflexota bacterium]
MFKNLRVLVSLLTVAMVLLTACGGGQATTAAPAPTEAPAATAAPAATEAPQPSGPVKATPGQAVSMVLLPKFLGILPFDQAHTGATEAATE